MSTQETTTKAKPAKTKKAKGSKKTAKAKVPKASKAATQAKGAKTGSKTAIVLDLMRRKEGATLTEIAKATGWQNHSIRGFVSGHVIKAERLQS